MAGITFTVDEDTLVALIDERLEAFVERIRAELDEAWLDAEASGAYLCLSRQQIYNEISAGRLRRYGPPGTKLLLRRSDLDRWAVSREGAAKIRSASKGAAIHARIPRRGTERSAFDAAAE